ncbi:hypothetical protein [Embleya sp. AB8]|uniref:hypothetical protein n=1 Tax=Embleya sp. AB8 TaxID=3156304 RepID=UPI003C71AE1D
MISPRIPPALVLPVLILAAAGCTAVSGPTSGSTERPSGRVTVEAAPRPEAEPAPGAQEPAPPVVESAGGSADPEAVEGPGPTGDEPTADSAPTTRTGRPRPRAGAADGGWHRPTRTIGSAGSVGAILADPCGALAAGGVFPAGKHRWCRPRAGLR